MESDQRLRPQGVVPADDNGLLMKMESNPRKDHTESLLEKYGERAQDETTVSLSAPAVIPMCYSGMEDVGVDDDVFIKLLSPSSPSFMGPLLPAEGSTDITVNNSNLTFSNGASDATEAKANPDGLDWHHGEKQLMAEQNKLDELKESVALTSKETTDTGSKEKELPQSKDQDQISMEGPGCLSGKCHDPSGERHQDNMTGYKDLTEEPEDTESFRQGQQTWGKAEAESNTFPKKVHSHTQDMSKNDVHFYKDEEKKISEQTVSKQTTERTGCSGLQIQASTPCLKAKDEDLQYNQNNMDKTTNHPLIAESATEMYKDDKGEHVDTRSLNYKVAKHDWVRRESGISESLLPQLPTSEDSAETVSKVQQGQESRRIATNIQQGEQLLQRLHLLQQRQDVHITENTQSSQPQQDVLMMTSEAECGSRPEENNMKTRIVDTANEDKNRSAEDGGIRANFVGEEKNERKSWLSLPTISVKPEHYPVTKAEFLDSDDDKSDVWGPADWTSIEEMSSDQIPLVSNRPRLSVAETSLEKQIHEAAQKKQNLQRAGGVFNLADNLDVIEIPFKTDIMLEPVPTKVGVGHRNSRQFSEQKMQKEISQEIQRELVLVNQGKIPGNYSKGEVRQLKETKLLFEALQQENMEGQTKHQISPFSPTKGRAYPSVLERTRSLEMFSIKSLPFSRTHSLRVNDSVQMKTSPEEIRGKSPPGSLSDTTHSGPYLKQDKHARQYRSMDLLSTVAIAETMREVTEANLMEKSPVLQHNPFFKLRPALVLQPEVEKDIREAKEREEELRRQRCILYGENRWKSKDEEKSRFAPALTTDATGPTRGKLERYWPPPSKNDQKPEQTQQEGKVHRTGGQKTSLWQRWESGQINGQASEEKN